MLYNKDTAISTSKVLLVPYSKHHVPQYHEWMEDEALRDATESERLTLDQEFLHQQTWTEDPDTLTFIVCESSPDLFPLLTNRFSPSQPPPNTKPAKANIHDSAAKMIGDVNMFLSIDDRGLQEDAGRGKIIAELSLMIAKSGERGKGYGTSALLIFIDYVLRHEDGIKKQFCQAHNQVQPPFLSFSFRAKIKKDNAQSLRLFESTGFTKVSKEPNYFGEYELRWEDGLLNRYDVMAEMARHQAKEPSRAIIETGIEEYPEDHLYQA